MNIEEIKTYLDNVITIWRKRKEESKNALINISSDSNMAEQYNDEIFMSRCYIDAYQSVRISLFGELLP